MRGSKTKFPYRGNYYDQHQPTEAVTGLLVLICIVQLIHRQSSDLGGTTKELVIKIIGYREYAAKQTDAYESVSFGVLLQPKSLSLNFKKK